MPPPCSSSPPQNQSWSSAQAEESHPSRTHRCCGMPAPSLLFARASPQQESQTSSEHPLKGVRGEDGKRKLSEKEQRGRWVWFPCTPPLCHAAMGQRWLWGSLSRCPHSQAGLRSSTTSSPGCFGVLAKVPFTVRQWELSPPQTPHLSSCFREPTSLSQPTCCHPRGEKANRGYIPMARLSSARSPHLHHHHVPGPLLHTGLGLWAKIHVSNPKKRWAKGMYEMCPLSWKGSAPYHALAPDTDAVGVPVAAPGTVVNDLVHEHHVPRPFGLADQLALLGIWGKTQSKGEKKNEKHLLKCIRLGENRNPSQLVPVSTARLQKPRLFSSLVLPCPFAAQEPVLLPSTLWKARESNWAGHATSYRN